MRSHNKFQPKKYLHFTKAPYPIIRHNKNIRLLKFMLRKRLEKGSLLLKLLYICMCKPVHVVFICCQQELRKLFYVLEKNIL